MIKNFSQEAVENPVYRSARFKSFWTLLITGSICFGLTVGIYIWVRDWQHMRISSELDRTANAYRTVFREKIHSYVDQLDALRRFFHGSEAVDWSEFSRFVDPVLENNPAIKFFIWAPRTQNRLNENSGGIPTETAVGRQAIEGAQNPELTTFPITYVESFPEDWSNIGFDLSAESACADLFRMLAKSDKPGISTNTCGSRALTQFYDDPANMALIIEPVYQLISRQSATVSDDQVKHLKGFVVLGFDIGRSFESSISGTSAGGIDIELIDNGGGQDSSRLYTHASRAGAGDASLLMRYLEGPGIKRTVPLDIRSVDWMLEFSPISKFYQRHYRWQAEFVGAFGLMLMAGILFFVYWNGRRFILIEKIVDARTQSLRASEREQISTLESISDIFFTVDSNWRFLYVNPKAEELIGMGNSDLRGKELWDECPELASFFHRPLSRALKSQKTQHADLLAYPPKDRWFSLTAYPRQNGLSIYMIDRTQQEKERKHREKIEFRTQAILDSAVDGVITIDSLGTVQSMNPAAQAMFGYSEKEVAGRNINMLMPEPDHSRHDGYLRNYLRSGEGKITGIGREVSGLRSTGEIFPMHLSVSQFKSGDTINFAGIVRDISEQREALRQIVEAKEAAEVANKAKSSFLDSMSHELRTPLNAIIGFSQMLGLDVYGPLSEKQREYVRDITASGELLLQLVSQVLDLSTIESGRLTMTVADVEVGGVIRECLTMTRAMAEEKNLMVIDRVSEAGDLVIRSDAVRLKQVILNLLSNAVKYNKDGGTITVHAEKSARQTVWISVSDTGAGISPENLERVFEPFNRLGREALSIEGTGIGLTIVKYLMEVLGGRVELTSEIGKGSIFRIELPYASRAE